jgi:hypothetical protein
VSPASRPWICLLALACMVPRASLPADVSVEPSKLRIAELSLQTQVNAAIRKRAGERKDLHYIDVATHMLDEGRPKDLFVTDGLHMNAKGYAIWTAAVRAALLPRIGAEVATCRSNEPAR